MAWKVRTLRARSSVRVRWLRGCGARGCGRRSRKGDAADDGASRNSDLSARKSYTVARREATGPIRRVGPPAAPVRGWGRAPANPARRHGESATRQPATPIRTSSSHPQHSRRNIHATISRQGWEPPVAIDRGLVRRRFRRRADRLGPWIVLDEHRARVLGRCPGFPGRPGGRGADLPSRHTRLLIMGLMRRQADPRSSWRQRPSDAASLPSRRPAGRRLTPGPARTPSAGSPGRPSRAPARGGSRAGRRPAGRPS